LVSTSLLAYAFIPWVERELPFGRMQANKYMRLWSKRDELPNANSNSHLNLDATLRALAVEQKKEVNSRHGNKKGPGCPGPVVLTVLPQPQYKPTSRGISINPALKLAASGPLPELVILDVDRRIVEIQATRERSGHHLDILVLAAALSHYSPL
jgi:hypothetical protein